jgi:hypothetical protein
MVATALADALRLPLLAKDDIKETLGEWLGVADSEASARLGLASIEVLWTLAAKAPSAVLESYWYPDFTVPRLNALAKPIVEVFCDAPRAVCISRFVRRRASGRHHVHQERFMSDEDLAAATALWPEPEPLGVGTLIRVDTTAPIDVGALADEVCRGLPGHHSDASRSGLGAIHPVTEPVVSALNVTERLLPRTRQDPLNGFID